MATFVNATVKGGSYEGSRVRVLNNCSATADGMIKVLHRESDGKIFSEISKIKVLVLKRAEGSAGKVNEGGTTFINLNNLKIYPVCRNFGTGDCAFGQECKFSHMRPPEALARSPTATITGWDEGKEQIGRMVDELQQCAEGSGDGGFEEAFSCVAAAFHAALCCESQPAYAMQRASFVRLFVRTTRIAGRQLCEHFCRAMGSSGVGASELLNAAVRDMERRGTPLPPEIISMASDVILASNNVAHNAADDCNPFGAGAQKAAHALVVMWHLYDAAKNTH